MTPAEPPAAQTAPPALQRLRGVVLAATAALIALGLAWELWLAPIGRGTLALKVLPLAAALPGLARHRMYTYRWLSLLAWLYVGEGTLRAASDSGSARALAGLETALALALFATCTAYIRQRLRRAAVPG